MLSKRDLQLVRLAVRWKWFTPEQGEDLLFLKRKFAGKLTLEEIIRRRRYLGDAEIEQLAQKADEIVGGERRRGRRRADVVRSPATSSDRPAQRTLNRTFDPQQTIAFSQVQERATDPSARSYEAGETMAMDSVPVAKGMEDLDNEGKTVIAPMSFEMKEVIERAKRKAAQPREALDPDPFVEKTTIATRAEIDALRQKFEADRRPGPVPGSEIDEGQTTLGIPAVDRKKMQHQLRPVPRAPSLQMPVVSDVPVAPSTRGAAVPDESFEEQVSTESRFEDDGTELVGTEFGPYLIERVIARGARGVLYRADTPRAQKVALKVLAPETANTEGVAKRFQEQAAKVAKIVSPNCVRLIDYGTIDGRPFFATEYVDAWTLEERIDSGDRPGLMEALSIARDIARGLAEAHAVGVVHQDINPDNVLIGRRGEVLISGFAFPKRVEGVVAQNGRQIFGTVGYLAPEQAMALAIDPRTDLYALGATLFHLVTGRKTIEGESSRASIVRLLRDPIEDVRALDPLIPEPVAAIVARLLSTRPDHRYASAQEVAEVLTRAIDELRVKGVPSAASALDRTKRALLVKAAASSAIAASLVIVVPTALRAMSVIGWSSEVALQDALFGSLGIMIALVLLSALALVRRGELPLPMSTAWLVRVQDTAGALGAALLVAGVGLGPRSVLSVLVAVVAIGVLVSWIYGILLRRTIAFLRPDRGVGRMLAVLGDPSLEKWRLIHVPLLSTLTGLATMRLAFLAYFASSQSVVS